MRGLLWIAGVSALIACRAVLADAALLVDSRAADALSAKLSRAENCKIATDPQPSSSPILRTAMLLPGHAMLPRPSSGLVVVSCSLVGECPATRLRITPASGLSPGETLLSKRVRLQI